MQPHTLAAVKTARYYTLGNEDGPVREIWMVCHGYGQLAEYFLRHFREASAPGRLVVAPEALSRFYLDGDGPNGPGRYQRVAACWMTRDGRDDDVADYVRFLDDVFVAVCARAGADPLGVRFVGLGFSQGTATVTRWAERSPVLARRARRLDRLILWGGALPHDLDLEAAQSWLAPADLTLVAGDRDPYATPARVLKEEARMAEARVPFRTLSFAGEHRLHAPTLRALSGRAKTDGPTEDA